MIGLGLNVRMPREAGEAIDQPWIDLAELGIEDSRNTLAARLIDALFTALRNSRRAASRRSRHAGPRSTPSPDAKSASPAATKCTTASPPASPPTAACASRSPTANASSTAPKSACGRMTLLLDLGNTRLKAAWLRDGEPGGVARFALEDANFAHSFENWLRESATPVRGEPVEPHSTTPRAWLAAVAPDHVLAPILTLLDKHAIPSTRVSTQSHALGIRIAYTDPARLGVDRWLNLVAARRLVAGPVLVASVGTALTVDALLADGTHLGGLIAASPDAARAALVARAPRLDVPRGTVARFAASTEDAIESGAILAATALIERSLHELERVAGTHATLLLTGGGAAPLQPWLTPHRRRRRPGAARAGGVGDRGRRGIAPHARSRPARIAAADEPGRRRLVGPAHAAAGTAPGRARPRRHAAAPAERNRSPRHRPHLGRRRSCRPTGTRRRAAGAGMPGTLPPDAGRPAPRHERADAVRQPHPVPREPRADQPRLLGFPARAGHREAALAAARELSAQGLRDYFVVTAGDQENTISLGLFRDRGNAETRQREVQALGFSPLLEERTEEIPNYWIELAAAPGLDWRAGLGGYAGVESRPLPCE